ncbi:MAG: lipocalin-like domain-containing protein [Alloprevotella sp.]
MKFSGIGKRIVMTVALALVLVGCDVETSGNGDFDGFWHLERIDTLATGGVLDLSGQRLFWGVQYRLINMKDYDTPSANYYLRFSLKGKELQLSEPYHNYWHEDEDRGGDRPLTDTTLLRPFGINGLDSPFEVETLKGGSMQLKSETLRLRFRKF